MFSLQKLKKTKAPETSEALVLIKFNFYFEITKRVNDELSPTANRML